MNDSPLILALKDGRELSVARCWCHECSNEFYVPSHVEFTPTYCPYCGTSFVVVHGKETM